RTLVLLVLSLGLSSCSRYFYAPVPHGDLVPEKKGDFKASVGGGSVNDILTINEDEEVKRRSHFDAQLAYSPAEHIGLHLSSQTFRERSVAGEVSSFTNSDFVNFSVGYYQTSKKHVEEGNEVSKRRWVWENSLGLGYGNLRYQTLDEEDYGLEFTKLFVQSNFVFNATRHFQFGLSLSPTLVRYLPQSFPEDPDLFQWLDLVILRAAQPLFYAEVGFHIQYGWKKFKFFSSSRFTNVGFPFRYSKTLVVPHLPRVSTLGIIVEVDDLFKKRKTTRRRRG
ncbi:MAG: hypothetical protein AAF146_23300, partial [Bacteroidota bacterium]